MNEKWLSVEEFPAYEVSDSGKIRRAVGGKGAVCGREQKWHTCTSNGYANVRLSVGGKTFARSVHKVVSRAFLGPMRHGLCVRHLDGNKLNNQASNLAYGTPADNSADMVKHGRSLKGEKNHKAKISHVTALSIRDCYTRGTKVKALALRHGLCQSTVHRIVSGKYWTEASNRMIDRATQ